VLDSTAVISAERNEQPIPVFIEAILRMHGPINLSLSPVTVAELVHGVYRAKTPAAGQRRREYIEELVSLVPVHPMTNRTAWLVGQIEGQEAAKGNTLPFNDLMIAGCRYRARLRGSHRQRPLFQENPRPRRHLALRATPISPSYRHW